MKKNLLLLLALSAGALTLWSQEPSYQASTVQNPSDMPMLLRAPENVYISGTECQLDKYILPNQRMEEYVYDDNSIICTRYDFDWSTNDWRQVGKSNSVYNSDGKLTQFESFKYSPYTNDWVSNLKCEYQYDAEGHTIFVGKYRWSESKNDWECLLREEGRFSESGQKVYNAKWCPDKEGTSLTGTLTETVLYENGSAKEKVNSVWDDQLNDWVLSTKESLTYNSHGFTSSSIICQWNAEDLSWEKTKGNKYEYIYTKGKPQTVRESAWDKVSDEWYPKYLTTYTYDEKGRKISRERTDAFSQDVQNGYERDVYEYNNLNQVVLHNAYLWDNEAQDWWLSYNDEFSFDQYGNVNSSVRYKWLLGNPECFGWQRWERDYTDERKVAMKADYKWDAASKSWVGKCRQQLSKDDLGLDLDLAVNYAWTPEGWNEKSYNKVDFDQDSFVATVTEYESNTDKVIAQKQYFYSPIGTTGITSVLGLDNASFNIEGNCITTADNGLITIYSIDGKLVNSAAGKAYTPSTGFYIVKVGEQATKVYVK